MELSTFKDGKSSSGSMVALQTAVHDVPESPQTTLTQKRDFRFWMCIIAIMICSFLMVVDLVFKDMFYILAQLTYFSH